MSATATGRPLRFLVAVTLGWVGVRTVMLWPVPAMLVAGPRSPVAPPLMSVAMSPATQPALLPDIGIRAPAIRLPAMAGLRAVALVASPVSSAVARDPARIALAVLGMIRFGPPAALPVAEIAPPPPPQRITGPVQNPGHSEASRWWGSAWLLVRGDGTAPQTGLGGGLLGGSQAGVRVGYALDPARRLSLYGRVSSALSVPGREAAFGADWRPSALPVHVIAEQRVPLDGGRGGPTLGAVGGVGPLALPRDFRLEAYGEGGVILRDNGVGFADGAARIGRRIARAGPADIALGAGAWGAIQPGASRIDIGPAIVVDVPVRSHGLRLSLDWRQRVAGDARPASGPALTIGANF